MREYLFRGKSINNGEWVSGFYWSLTRDDIAAVHVIRTNRLTDTHEIVDPETVGQYTGLTDMNGRKIFEGDVVTIPGSKKQGLPAYVAWSEGNARFEIHRIGYNPLFFDLLYSADRGWYASCEVVGNIYDNPEYLFVKEAAAE